MASVVLCEDERLGRRVAVKRLPAHSPEDAARRFEREARLGASLNHPNLVSVYDTVADEEGVLIVMEHVEGHTLSEALREGPLPTERAVRVIAEVASALDHAHAHGVVHRDVKPANVLLRRDGVTKLADLGIAVAADSTRITGSGIVLGTASYMSPEELDGRKAGPPADVYALAAVATRRGARRRAAGATARRTGGARRAARTPRRPRSRCPRGGPRAGRPPPARAPCTPGCPTTCRPA